MMIEFDTKIVYQFWLLNLLHTELELDTKIRCDIYYVCQNMETKSVSYDKRISYQK